MKFAVLNEMIMMMMMITMKNKRMGSRDYLVVKKDK